MRPIVLLGVLLCAVSFAQDAADAQKAPTFRSGVNLVEVPVIVRNKQGQTIGNLKQDDFEIFDRGKRQTITNFSIIKRADDTGESESASSGRDGSPAPGTVLTGNEQKPSQAESPQRFVVYLFDDFDVAFADMDAVRRAMVKHIRDLDPGTRAAIYTSSGRPELDFTNDREKLEGTVAKLRSNLTSMSSRDAKECPNINYYLADLIRNRSDQRAHKAAVSHTVACAHVDPLTAEAIVSGAVERQLLFAPAQSRLALRVLRLAIRQLARMPGERLIVLTSPGFFAQTPEAIVDTENVLKLAGQANVTINVLNARGLSTAASEAGDSAETSTLWWQYYGQSVEADEGILEDLAQGTGGVYYHNNNNLRAGFDRLAKPPAFSYVLAFQPTNAKQDGSFHRLKIRFPNEKGLKVEARSGYYALKQDPQKDAARLDVDDALFARDQKNEIPVVLQTGYEKPNKVNPTVTVITKVGLRPLHFRKANGRNVDAFTVVSALFNRDGNYLIGTTKTVNLQLRNETLKQADPSVTLRFDFPVKRGAYTIRVVVRDAQSSAMTTFTRPEVIP